MKKQILAAVVAAAVALSVPMTVSAAWQKDSAGNWQWSENGTLQTGWKQIGGKWYHFDQAGKMSTGWLKDGGTWYYLNAGGDMATGWKQINGAWYYLKGSGAMATGWQSIEYANYYFYPDGKMATNTEKDGYQINDSGVATKVEFYQKITGSGDDVVSNVTVGDGIYRVYFTHSGKRNFAVWAYDATGDRDLLINTIGHYNGYVLLEGDQPYTFEITADGQWSYTIERLENISETSFSGKGDYVTNIFPASSGTWQFTHDGNHNFAVWVHTTEGRDLLVNTIGKYNGKKLVIIPSDSNAVFQIAADGNWSASPID